MDILGIFQVIMIVIFTKKDSTPSGATLLLLLVSLILPIFILGWLRAIVCLVISVFAATMVIVVKDAISGN